LTDDQGRLIPRWTKTRKPSDDSIRISQTVVRQVLETKQAQLREVLPEDLQTADSLVGIGFFVCAPLLDSAEKAIGVIHLDTLHRRKPFKREDMELLASVAIQAGITIENAQVHETVVQLQKLELDVQLANEVQRAFLPKHPPACAGYAFFDYYNAARSVGGDYYDYVQLPDGRTAIIVADVAGKGVAAALVMARVSAEAKFCLATEARPSGAMNRLNERLCQLGVDRFVTMVILVLDPRTHDVTIVNAGHMPPIWWRADGTVEEPSRNTSSMALGIVPDIQYQEAVISLGPGESLTLYTDGVTDATDADGKDFQTQRILDHVKNAGGSAQNLGQSIVGDLQQFIGSHPQTDDICLVCVARVA
jgi:serine phosphatase RsbU (regulator of sigma subunit)